MINKIKFQITKDKVAKIFMFMLFLSCALAYIVTFVGKEVTNLYGNSVLHGFGLILLMVSWILWSSITNKKTKNDLLKIIILIIMIISSSILLPSILSFVMMSIIVLFVSFYFILKYFTNILE